MKTPSATATASVVQLKARLSEYLRRVKAGNELVITERGLPIARVVPLDVDTRRATREGRLIRSGVLRPGRPAGDKKSRLVAPKGAPLGVLDALLANRDEDER